MTHLSGLNRSEALVSDFACEYCGCSRPTSGATRLGFFDACAECWVRIPKCKECEGSGEAPHATSDDCEEPCSRCDGAGYPDFIPCPFEGRAHCENEACESCATRHASMALDRLDHESKGGPR